MKIGITGAFGFLGFHLRAYFKSKSNFELALAGREVFSDLDKMSTFVRDCDVIVHLAGVNRSDNNDALIVANISLAEQIVNACEQQKVTPHIIYASTTHVDRDTAYGKSKKRAGEIFQQWADKHHATFANLIIPNVFGEFGRPFYNSAVSTFCYQLANKEQPVIIHDNQIELIHAQNVAIFINNVIHQHLHGIFHLSGVKLKVSELLEKLQSMAQKYSEQLLLPDLREHFDLELFNTYRSYLFPHAYPVALQMRTDERGSLFEAVRTLNGGQAFLSTTLPSITRGNHYHTSKVERFLVVGGEAVICLRKLFDSKVYEFKVSGSHPQYIDMPTFFTHSIRNVGQVPLMTMFWSHEIFDPNNSDTFQELV
ncbi:MAG TPA: capsule biosynthesis protein CapF [Methylophilaceae bacterium]|nr:capsule biosynthesis protein CapF [Methylophilaceae bacterium]HAJ72594.1 capsule biosynthesis protein CapF [Methylophilaceae bacterium]